MSECALVKTGQPRDLGVNGEVVASHQPAFVDVAEEHASIIEFRQRFSDGCPCKKCTTPVSMAALPLMQEGELIGILDVFFYEPHVFSEREQKLLTEWARVLSSSLAITRRIERAESSILQTYALASRAFILGGMIHRIRGLFANVLPSLDTIKDYDLPRNEIVKEAVSMKGVLLNIQDILDKAMVFRHQPVPEVEVYSLREVVSSLLHVTNLETRNTRVKVEVDIKADPTVECTLLSLEMVIESLMQNAYDAVRETGGQVKISLEADPDNAILTIADSGPGFPDDIVPEPWSPLDNPRPGHSGMGLYFAYWALETMKGRFDFARVNGTWTTATVRIPLHKGEHQ